MYSHAPAPSLPQRGSEVV
jgi:membrane protein YqaA with SNARE-associated domain